MCKKNSYLGRTHFRFIISSTHADAQNLFYSSWKLQLCKDYAEATYENQYVSEFYEG